MRKVRNQNMNKLAVQKVLSNSNFKIGIMISKRSAKSKKIIQKGDLKMTSDEVIVKI